MEPAAYSTLVGVSGVEGDDEVEVLVAVLESSLPRISRGDDERSSLLMLMLLLVSAELSTRSPNSASRVAPEISRIFRESESSSFWRRCARISGDRHTTKADRLAFLSCCSIGSASVR